MYKVFTIAELYILNSDRWAGNAKSVRPSNDKEFFVTQFASGLKATPEELEGMINHEEVTALMLTPKWKQKEVI